MAVVSNISNNSLLSVDDVNSAVSFVNPIIIQVVVAALIFFIAVVVGKIVEKLLTKLFEIIELNKLFSKIAKLKFSLSYAISKIVSYFIIMVGLIMALNRLAITTAIITTIVIALIIILALFLIFGINDLFANFFAGLVIRLRKNISVGDYVKIKDKDKNIEGHIISLNTLHLRLETGREETVFIPNMALFQSEIVKKNQVMQKSKKRSVSGKPLKKNIQ